ncbi:MAG: IS91 family transposase [Gammaproteobacteria bacterium]|nr:IS91 family transposase [Gammaproteobacteria bacterium]
MINPTVQTILQQHLDDYSHHHKLDSHRLKVCRHLLHCHTPALGGLQYQCDHCDTQVPLYHSCRDRHCPGCQQRATRQWAQRQQQDVLPVTYYHLVFTLPHELNGWMQLHPEEIYSRLFQVVWQTLKAFGADPKRLDGKLGMTAVLHTWGQNLSQHVHLHCLIPGGALGKDHQWHESRSTYLFPVKALSRCFRGKMVSALRALATEGKLQRITHANEIDRVLNQLMHKDWVVYSKHCLNRTETVIGYLARYSHRIAISNQRLIGMEKDQVTFRYKNYLENKMDTIKLEYAEFIRRFLVHVLPKGLMRIRHYGFLSNRCRKHSLEVIRKVLAKPAERKDKVERDEPVTYPCPKCHKGHLVFVRKLNPVSSFSKLVPG